MPKRYIKKFCCTLIICSLLSSNALALSNITDWAKSDIETAYDNNIVPDSLENAEATQSITRAEFCEIALNLYNNITTQEVTLSDEILFTDTDLVFVSQAASLGIVSGRGDGIFDPDGAITRQELCKILDNIATIANCDKIDINENCFDEFPDKDDIASWALDSVAHMLSADIIRGISYENVEESGYISNDKRIDPLVTTTREQAIIMAVRFYNQYKSSYVSPDAIDPETGSANTNTSTDTNTAVQDDNTTSTETDDGFDLDSSLVLSIPTTTDEKMDFVFGEDGSYFATAEIALLSMSTITVPVWRLNDGVKTADTTTITVNKNLAAIFIAIFIEIYRGDEQFPISDVYGYAWRSSATSEHRWGTAVDINYMANMEATINDDGTLTPTTGTHWTPDTDPFSIPEDGDVYNAFTKYGFSWGGNAWTSKRDYMHFSFFGK